MILKVPFEFGDIVYLKTDPEQLERMVYRVVVTPPFVIILGLAQGTVFTEHYDFEVTKEKDLMKELNISENKQAR